ncbi:unnamed protein product [Sphenostylis stenocarpa]|uniref:Uncharacterized protein n=1 Tax=Sphenostylis stenocarpa TaxID=92480 RepID=A0AA86SAY5_9FABA|nr:unnamed protein product [Sphenostylis stenocarpa]
MLEAVRARWRRQCWKRILGRPPLVLRHRKIESGPFGTFVGVYNGHDGPDYSRYVCDNLFRNLQAILAESQSVVTSEAIQQAFRRTEEGFTTLVSKLWNSRPQIATTGTCCVLGWKGGRTWIETDIKVAKPLVQGLQIIHLCDVDKRVENDLELLHKLVTEYKVPASLRFSLLSRLRFARAFGSLASRQQYTCIRLYAFIVLIQACARCG